jgi:DeoR/GlpR family transcriptional regulator of sugar metabolism
MPIHEGLKLDVRRKNILELIGREGKVRVMHLSQALGASEVTIRNDLAELEKSGYLHRVPGGAVQTMQNYYNMDFQQRKHEHTQEKQAIAVAAAELVRDGETLMINSGTTTYFTALALKRCRNLKIVTNSISIALELGSVPTFHVILLGGDINPHYSFTYGDDALAQLKKFKADKLILSVDGVSSQIGITTYHAEETEVNRTMMERAGRTLVVADYTKIGYESFSNLGSIDCAHWLVTNKEANQEVLAAIEARGVKVISC